MIKVINSNKIGNVLVDRFDSCSESIEIISPYLSLDTAKKLCKIKSDKKIPIKIITRLYLEDMLKKSNSIYAIKEMCDAGIDVFAVKGLHTKLYICDESDYFLGSANFTLNGLYRNLELIVQIDKDEESVKRDLDKYFRCLEKECIDNNGIVDMSLVDEIIKVYEDAKEKRIKHSMETSDLTYGASIEKKEPFDDFEDPTKEKDPVKRKKIICQKESDPIGKQLKETISYKWTKNEGAKFFLKMEGSECEHDEIMEPIEVEINGKKKYVLNYPEKKKPGRINNGDVFYFCCSGYQENDYKIQKIVARGHLCEYEKDYHVKKEWIKKNEWMKKYKTYSIISDIEVLNVPRECGINSSEIIRKVGEKIIAGSKVKSFKPKDFSKSWQGSFKITTLEASEAIDEEFDKLVKIYGSSVYRSEF